MLSLFRQGGPRIYLTLSEAAMIFLAPSIVTEAGARRGV